MQEKKKKKSSKGGEFAACRTSGSRRMAEIVYKPLSEWGKHVETLKHMCLHINYHVCMHLHAQAQTQNTHESRCLPRMRAHIRLLTHAEKHIFTEGHTHACHCNSHDHSLYVKETGNCQNDRSWGLILSLLSEPVSKGWQHERPCPLKLTLSTPKTRAQSVHGCTQCPPVCSLIYEKLLLLLTYSQAAFVESWGVFVNNVLNWQWCNLQWSYSTFPLCMTGSLSSLLGKISKGGGGWFNKFGSL